MPEFDTWAILLMNQQDEIGEKQLSVFGFKARTPLYCGIGYATT